MEYLLKASTVVAIFYGCYHLFLQRHTFFESNRWFLLVGLVSAFSIPLIIIPIYLERPPIILDNLSFENAITTTQPIKESIHLIDIFTYIYFAGVLFFLGRFLFQLTSLILVLFYNKRIKLGRYTYVTTHKNLSPFSFFNWIVYNPTLFNKTELEQILTHEKVHARQHHSIDIMLTQFACIALWFNPFIWLYNKNLKQNLEFIADQNAQQKSVCKKSYQYTLLKTSMPTHQLALTNNFYNSLIKKRIVMLHKSKSKKSHLLKYTLVIPFLAVFLMSFNTKEVYVDTEIVPQEKTLLDTYNWQESAIENNFTETETEKQVAIRKDIEMFLISNNFSDADFNELKEKLENKGITAKFKGIKRNSNDEIIAIKIEIKSKHSNANYSVSSDEPIKPIKISFEDNGKNISISNASNHQEIKVIGYGDSIKWQSKNKGNHFIIKKDNTSEDIHIINGDTIKWKEKNENKQYKIRKHKNVKVITDDDEDKHFKVIIKNDSDDNTDDEDIIILKKVDAKDKGVKIKKEISGSMLFIEDDDEKEPLFILDGKEVDKDGFEDIDSDQIHSVFVLKGEKALEKYGDEGKDGVVEMTTKGKKSKFIINSDETPLVFIDGKAVTKKQMEELNPEDIESIDVLKGESATKTYGDKGKNGIIKITTKKEK